MQLPPEMWWLIFKIRTKMIYAEHYSNWLLKHTEYNKKIAKSLIYLLCDDHHSTQVTGFPTRVHFYVPTSTTGYSYITTNNTWFRNKGLFESNKTIDLEWKPPCSNGILLFWTDGDHNYCNVRDYEKRKIRKPPQKHGPMFRIMNGNKN